MMRRAASAASSPRQVFRGYPGDPPEPLHPFCPRCGTACVARDVGGRERSVCTWCLHVQYRNPAPGVCVVVLQGDHVLLGRRTAGDRWAFPAGFIEFEEDFLTAARREAYEETGLEVAITGILAVSSNHHSERLHALVVAVAATRVGGDLRPGDEFSELCWLPVGGPLPPLAYEPDADLLSRLDPHRLRVLPVDERHARGV